MAIGEPAFAKATARQAIAGDESGGRVEPGFRIALRVSARRGKDPDGNHAMHMTENLALLDLRL